MKRNFPTRICSFSNSKQLRSFIFVLFLTYLFFFFLFSFNLFNRPPLLGFAHMEPQFSIRCVEVGDDDDTGKLNKKLFDFNQPKKIINFILRRHDRQRNSWIFYHSKARTAFKIAE